jgi:glycosyltransferase involved in cell wall biosynthesis
MKICVIVKAWNRLEYTITAIRRIWFTRPEGIDIELAVIDQGSTDGTAQWLETNKTGCYELSIYHNDKNLGETFGVLPAVEGTDADYILTHNNDMYPLTRDWITKLAEGYKIIEGLNPYPMIEASWAGCWSVRKGQEVPGHPEIISGVAAGGNALMKKSTFMKMVELGPLQRDFPNARRVMIGGEGYRHRKAWNVHMQSTAAQALRHPSYYILRYSKMPMIPETPCRDDEGRSYNWRELIDDSEIAIYSKVFKGLI